MRTKLLAAVVSAGLIVIMGGGAASALTIDPPGPQGELQPIAPGGPADGPGVTDGQGDAIDGAWEAHDRTDNDVITGA